MSEINREEESRRGAKERNPIQSSGRGPTGADSAKDSPLISSSFGKMESSHREQALLEALGAPQSIMRDRAVEELRNSKDKKITAQLIKLLRSRKPIIREAAARALEGATDPSAFKALKGSLKDKDANVRYAAARSLRLSYLARKAIGKDE